MHETEKSKPDWPPLKGFLRLPKVLDLYPVSEAAWWAGVKEGRYPKPVKLSPRCSAWTVESIKQLIDSVTAQN